MKNTKFFSGNLLLQNSHCEIYEQITILIETENNAKISNVCENVCGGKVYSVLLPATLQLNLQSENITS